MKIKIQSAQNLVEYLLIAALVAIMLGIGFVAKFDFNALKNYVFMRPTESNTINIEAMTDVQ